MPIDPYSLRQFVGRWCDKSLHAADGEDAPYVDEFVFAYIAFNAAFTAAAYVEDGPVADFPRWSYRRGGPPVRKFPNYGAEKIRASKLVVLVAGLGPLQALMRDFQPSLEEMCALFTSGTLYLYETKVGAPDHRDLSDRITVNSNDLLYQEMVGSDDIYIQLPFHPLNGKLLHLTNYFTRAKA